MVAGTLKHDQCYLTDELAAREVRYRALQSVIVIPSGPGHLDLAAIAE